MCLPLSQTTNQSNAAAGNYSATTDWLDILHAQRKNYFFLVLVFYAFSRQNLLNFVKIISHEQNTDKEDSIGLFVC